MKISDWKGQMGLVIRNLPDFAYGDLELRRNAVGNLSIVTADGVELGYIDVARPDDSQLPVAMGGEMPQPDTTGGA